MIASIINLRAPYYLNTKKTQPIRFINSISLTVTLLYFFYAFYGIFIGCEKTCLLATTFAFISLSAYFINVRGNSGVAKVLLLCVTSFSVFFTYQIYPISNAILTSYFPILLTYVFFFDFSKEKPCFVVSLIFTLSTILLSLMLPRFLFLKMDLSEEVVLLSNQLHIVVSFIITGVLLIIVIKNKNKINQEFLLQKQKAEKAFTQLAQTQGQMVQSEKMASLGLLTAGINHEINNPLNFIVGGLENLKHILNDTDNEEIENYISIIDEGVNRITEIVNSLNHFSYQSSELEMECDLEYILNNCLNIMTYQVGSDIAIEKNYRGNVIAKGHQGQLHQVFLNLISNAIHAIDKKGVITLTTGIRNNKAFVAVKDTGVGISESLKNKIFDPFFTTKEPGKGTGLGLSISYKIISEHDGSIDVVSELQKGTEFIISLPLKVLD